jgi:hypothetical protein
MDPLGAGWDEDIDETDYGNECPWYENLDLKYPPAD